MVGLLLDMLGGFAMIRTATPEDAEQALKAIRRSIEELCLLDHGHIRMSCACGFPTRPSTAPVRFQGLSRAMVDALERFSWTWVTRELAS
jgi:hypothetical protein